MLFTLLASLKLEYYAWDAIEMKRMLCNLSILLLQTQFELDDGDCKFLDTNFSKKKEKKRRIEMPSLNIRDFGQLLNRRYSAFMQNLSILVSGNVLCFDSYIFLIICLQ